MRSPIRSPEETAPGAATAAEAEILRRERDVLLDLLAQQQRVSQAGLVTSALVHDFNNQVACLSGSAYLALQGNDPAELRQALEEVQSICCTLTEMTRSFLSFVKRSETAGETLRLSRVVAEACRLLKPMARSQGVTLTEHVAEDCEVAGSPRLLTQSVVNLVSNAIRACSEKRGAVAVEASCPSQGSGRIVVRDNGPGIPEAIRARLFRPLTTGHGNSGGHGLGLFIVRRTVAKMGGSIKVASSPSGTVFQIDLPRL